MLELETCHPKSLNGRTTSPHLKVCTVLGALKDEQGGRVATIDELLQKVVWMTCLLPHLEIFTFSLLGGQPRRKEKERKLSL